MTLLHGLHVAAFWAAVAVAAALGVLALGDVVARRLHRFALDRLLLALLAFVAVGELTGLGMLVTGARPLDPLHLLYGAAALLVPAVARWLGRRPEARRRGAWLAAGSLAVAGVLFRLWTTG
jgi:hypothetical protein